MIRIGRDGWAWILYDFAYSMFAFIVFARYLSDWLISDLNYPDQYYTTTQFVVALTMLLIMPMAGMLADRIGRHAPLLAFFTLVACGSAAAIGVLNVPADGSLLDVLPVLVVGGICAGATGLAFAQFDPLLAIVARRRDWGTMSGVAVAAGYVGVLASLAIFGLYIVGDGSKQQAFIPVAVLFFALAIPAFFIREKGRHGATDGTTAGGSAMGYRQLGKAIGRLVERRDIMRLLAGRFLYADAVGTLNIYLAVYISRVGGYSEGEKNAAIAFGVAFAGIGALLAAWLVRRRGPRWTLTRVMPIFVFALIITAAFGQPWTIILLAPMVGISLGTIYTADRVFMLALTPDHLRGELFGFFNLIGRVAQAAGPFVLWGGSYWVLHDRTDWLSALDASRVALGLLALSAVFGLKVIWPLDDHHDESLRDAGQPASN